MNNIPKEVFIIGGGKSIAPYVEQLQTKLKDKFVITINYAHLHFSSTFTTCIDCDFYVNNKDILAKLPLIITGKQPKIQYYKLDNTILLPLTSVFCKDILVDGCYRKILSGVFSLTLSSWLMDWAGIAYLFGYDWTTKSTDTHYYTDIKHPGVGTIKFYQKHTPKEYFKHYSQFPELKIYNVIGDPVSEIDLFPKITYEQMFIQMNSETYNQDELRLLIKEKLCSTK